MSGSVLSQPKASEIQAALFRFVDYLKAQKLFQTEKDWSVKLLRNTYNQKFKYAVSYVSSLTKLFYFKCSNVKPPPLNCQIGCQNTE